MNAREAKVREELERDGWQVIRQGVPDFLAVKGSKLIAVEVKSPTDKLSTHQERAVGLLQQANIEVRVVYPNGKNLGLGYRRGDVCCIECRKQLKGKDHPPLDAEGLLVT